MPFPVDTSFEHTLFRDTILIGEELKKNDKSHEGSLNHWVGGIMHITFQTCYDLQYLTMRLSVYINSPTEHVFLALKHGMEYLMHHPYEPIMYSRKNIHITDEIPHQFYFKAGYACTSKKEEYSNFLHTYCDADNSIYMSDRRSVTSTFHLFNGTII